jgi:hypothetical protein
MFGTEREAFEGTIAVRSPIEMMIDKACGFKASDNQTTVMLRCPVCHKEKATSHDLSWPDGTKTVYYSCRACPPSDIRFLDRAGNDLKLR